MTVQELINALYQFNADREVNIAAYYQIPRNKNAKGFASYESMVLPVSSVRLVDNKIRIEFGNSRIMESR